MATDTPVEYDKETDPEGYWKVFQEFDEDGSGAVDVKEMKTMVEGLGMALTDAELKDYIKRADADESGEIEFEEFVQVLKAATAEGAMAAGGESFATLIRRKANSQSMKWREDRKSSKVTVDAASGTASFASEEGNGVVLLDQWIPGDNRYNIGSVLFEVKAKGPLWVGVVGRNFNPEGAWWEQDFFQVKPKNEKSQLITACKSTDGVIFVNGMNQAKGIPFGNASHPRIQMEVNKDADSLNFNIFAANGEVAISVQTDNLKAEFGVAVCFGPVAKGETSTVKVVGSSVEKVDKKTRRGSKDLWDEDNVAGVNDEVKGGVGSAELNGP